MEKYVCDLLTATLDKIKIPNYEGQAVLGYVGVFLLLWIPRVPLNCLELCPYYHVLSFKSLLMHLTI